MESRKIQKRGKKESNREVKGNEEIRKKIKFNKEGKNKNIKRDKSKGEKEKKDPKCKTEGNNDEVVPNRSEKVEVQGSEYQPKGKQEFSLTCSIRIVVGVCNCRMSWTLDQRYMNTEH